MSRTKKGTSKKSIHPIHNDQKLLELVLKWFVNKQHQNSIQLQDAKHHVTNDSNNGIEDDEELAILLTTGSLNPIHTGHIDMMNFAKTELESYKKNSTKYTVIGGFMSPSHDEYVRTKPSYIRSDDRVKMIKIAVQDSNWIECDEWECKQKHFKDFPQVCQRFSKEINDERFKTKIRDYIGNKYKEYYQNYLSEMKMKMKLKLKQDNNNEKTSDKNDNIDVNMEKDVELKENKDDSNNKETTNDNDAKMCDKESKEKELKQIENDITSNNKDTTNENENENAYENENASDNGNYNYGTSEEKIEILKLDENIDYNIDIDVDKIELRKMSIFYVCGRDHCDKCRLWDGINGYNGLVAKTLVVPRPDDKNNNNNFKLTSNFKSNYTNCIVVSVPKSKMIDDRSSTQIRKYIQDSKGKLENFNIIKEEIVKMKILHPKVLQYIQDKDNLKALYQQLNDRDYKR